MNNVEVCGENFKLIMNFLEIENERNLNLPEEIWLVYEYQVFLPGLQFSSRASFTLSDFQYMQDQLDLLHCSDNTNILLFDSYENWLTLNAKKNSLGKIQIDGEVKNHASPKVIINFSFTTDETFLVKTKKQITDLLTLANKK